MTVGSIGSPQPMLRASIPRRPVERPGHTRRRHTSFALGRRACDGERVTFIGGRFGAGVGGGFRRRGAGLVERGWWVGMLLNGLIQPASPWILRAGGILTDPVQARGGTFLWDCS